MNYFLFEIFLTLLDIILILRFYNNVYAKAENIADVFKKASVSVVAVTCIMRFILSPIRPASYITVTLMTSFLFLPAFSSSRQKKLLYSIALLTVSGLWLILYDLITSPMEHKNAWIVFLLYHTFLWIFLELIKIADKNTSNQLPFSLWFLLISISILSIAALFVIEYYILIRENPYLLTVEIPILSILLFINSVLFIFFDRFADLIHLEKEHIILEQELLMQNRYYKELEAAQIQIKSLHHDMKNFISTALELTSDQQNSRELTTYLKQLSDKVDHTNHLISTGNQYFDSILNIKMNEFFQENITVKTTIHIPPDLKIPFELSVTVLGNLLDNAREACLKIPAKDRWVHFNASYMNHTLFIKVENSCERQCRKKNGLPVTTKDNKIFHGLGLRNVKTAIDSNGTLNINSTDNTFTISLVLYDV